VSRGELAVAGAGLAAIVVLAMCAGDAGEGRADPPRTLRDRYGLTRPTAIDPRRTALILIDWQGEFFDGGLPVPDGRRALERAAALLAWARDAGLVIVHVDNVGRAGAPLFAPGAPTTAIMPEVAPRAGELRVTKATGGAFTHTSLDAELRARGVDVVIVTGLMTHLAIDITAHDAGLLGHHVIVVADATATRDLPAADGGAAIDHATLHHVALAALADRWADVMTSAEILALPRRASP
jgi:nicotinamidase-related amidase